MSSAPFLEKARYALANRAFAFLLPRGEYVSYVDTEDRFGSKLRTNFRSLVERTSTCGCSVADRRALA